MDWNRLEFGNGLEQVGNGLEQVGTVWNRLKLIDRACLRVKKSRMRLLRVTTVYSVQNGVVVSRCTVYIRYVIGKNNLS